MNNKMKNKLMVALMVILAAIAVIFWFQKQSAQKREFQAQQEIRKQQISQDSLVKLSDGYYQKLVADTLTQKQLKKLAAEIVELKNRKPVSVTKTVVQPVKIVKETDNVGVTKDSVFIEDYYPSKLDPFLKYTNRLSLLTGQGESSFDFSPITLEQVVTKKEDGLYQIDFKGPEFLEVNSLSIQAEPMAQPKPDNWGTLVGIEYGQNLETQVGVFEINAYQRFKKFYFGGAISSNKDLKGGIKIEF